MYKLSLDIRLAYLQDLHKLGISNKHDVSFILDELEKQKIEQAKYEDLSTQYSSSSQGTYYSSSSQGDSQFGSQPPPDYNSCSYKNSHTSSSSSSPRSDGKAAYHETIMLQLKRTFC